MKSLKLCPTMLLLLKAEQLLMAHQATQALHHLLADHHSGFVKPSGAIKAAMVDGSRI